MGDDPYDDEGKASEISIVSDVKVQEPSLYRVLMHNDDYTPMDFVIDVLQSVFHHKETNAKKIMLEVHNNGIAVCGVYSYDIAETKVNVVANLATSQEFPLRCSLERV